MEVVYDEEKTKSEPTTPEHNVTAIAVKSKKGKRRSSGPSTDQALPTDEIQQKFQQTDNRLLEIEKTHNLSAHNVKSILNRVVRNPDVISKFILCSAEGDGVLETTERSTRSKTKNDSVLNDIQLRPLNIPYCTLNLLSTEAFDYDESQDDYDIDYNPDNPVESIREEEPCSEQSGSECSSDDSGSDVLEQESELDDSLMFASHVDLTGSEESDSCENPSTSYATRSRAPNLNLDGLGHDHNDLTDFFDNFPFTDTGNATDRDTNVFSSLTIPFCRIENLNYDESQEADDTDYNPQEDDVDDKDERIEEYRTKKSDVWIPKQEVVGLIKDAYNVENIEEICIEPKGPRKRELKESKRQALNLPRWNQSHVKPTAQDTAQSPSCSLLNKKQNEIRFLPNEYEQLRCQLEQHVQLLVQMVVATYHTPELNHYKNEYQTKINLMEEYYRKFGDNSFFNISNLANAIDTCHDINRTKSVIAKRVIWAERCELNDHFIRPEACYVLSRSKALLYPELVPTQRPSACDLKTTEFTVVDNVLLALGFVQFGHVPNAIGGGIAEFGRYSLISTNVLRAKTPVQIKDHMSKVRYQKNHVLYRLVAQSEDGNPQITFSLRYDRLEGTMDTWTKQQLPMWYKEFKERFRSSDKCGRTELNWIPPPDFDIEKKKKKDRSKDKLLALRKLVLGANDGKRLRRNRTVKAHKPRQAEVSVKDDAQTSIVPASSSVEADSTSVTSDLRSLDDPMIPATEPLLDAAPLTPVVASSNQKSVLFNTPRTSGLANTATTQAVVKTVPPAAVVATPVPAGTKFMVRDANGVCHFLSCGIDEVFIIDENQPPVETNQTIVPCFDTNQLIPDITPANIMEEFVIINDEKLNCVNDLNNVPYDASLGRQLTPTTITSLHSEIAGTSTGPNVLNDLDVTYTASIWDSPGADHALYTAIGAGISQQKTPEKTVLRDSARRQIFISPSDPRKARSLVDAKEAKLSPAPSIDSIVSFSAPEFPSVNSVVDESVSIWHPSDSTEVEPYSEQNPYVLEKCDSGICRSPVPKRLRNLSNSPQVDSKGKQEAEELETESSMDVASKSSLDAVSRSSTDVVTKSRRKSAAPKKIIEKPKQTNRKSANISTKKTNVAKSIEKRSEKYKENNDLLPTEISNCVGGRRTVPESDKERPVRPSTVTRIEPSSDPRLRKRKRLESEVTTSVPPSKKQLVQPDSMDTSLTQEKLIVSPNNIVSSVAHPANGISNSGKSANHSESRHVEDFMDSSDAQHALPCTPSCSADMLSLESLSNMYVPRTPMPRALSESSQISPRTISYSPIDEDTNMLMMIPRTPRAYGSQSPSSSPIASRQRLTSRLKPLAEGSQSPDEESTHPFVSIYEHLGRKKYSPEDVEEQQKGFGVASCDPEDSNLNKMSRVQKMRAGEEGMHNIDYRDKQKQLLSRKIWSDVRQRLSMHVDTWSKVQAILQEFQSDPERQIAEFCDLLYEQHIDCLMLLTVFAPADYLPCLLMHHPLRKPYIDAFEMLMTIDSYAEHKKSGSARAYFRTLSKTDVNCSSNDICHHVRNVFGNDKPLWKKLRWFLPLAFDEDISQEDFENLDLTKSVGDEDDLVYEHLVLEPQFDVHDQNSNRNVQVIGDSLFVHKGGNPMEVNVHCLRRDEQEIFPSTSTEIEPEKIECAEYLFPYSEGNKSPSSRSFDKQARTTKGPQLCETVNNNHVAKVTGIDSIGAKESNEEPVATSDDHGKLMSTYSEALTTKNQLSQAAPSAATSTWTKENDLKLLNIYNNSEEEDQDMIAAEAALALKYPLEDVNNRLSFLLAMFN